MDQEKKPDFEIPETQLEELRNQAKERVRGTRHEWRQRGGWITCNTCDFGHGFRITSEKRLTGIDESGMPILEHR